ncbi:hypothetical protein C7B61_00370 [filamentous cyanobacterium CCP1]|nr:hypothetical protein C7B76_16695 [filamentous cyanobacterium CCP2]PSB68551.1 hypothetical protein C7B61_00370 [filamentous cyanobacterium CCP1]
MILRMFIPKQAHLLRVRSYPSLPLTDKWQLPRVSGIYYAVRGWQILYIGKSSNIHARWNSYQFGKHHKQDELLQIHQSVGDIDLHWVEFPEPLIGFMEAIEIKRFSPRLNIRQEKVIDNINLPVLWLLAKKLFWDALMLVLAIGVVGLVVQHFIF